MGGAAAKFRSTPIAPSGHPLALQNYCKQFPCANSRYKAIACLPGMTLPVFAHTACIFVRGGRAAPKYSMHAVSAASCRHRHQHRRRTHSTDELFEALVRAMGAGLQGARFCESMSHTCKRDDGPAWPARPFGSASVGSAALVSRSKSAGPIHGRCLRSQQRLQCREAVRWCQIQSQEPERLVHTTTG